MEDGPRNPSIELREIWADQNRLLCRISFDESLRKYFQTGLLYVKYDTDIDYLSTSLLTIPLVSSIMAVSWATGAKIIVHNLDSEFLNSMNDIQEFMKKRNWYPGFSFAGSIKPKHTETNRFGNSEKSALLYSGGIDSITSYLKNRKSNPELILIRGPPDDPLYQEQPWTLLKKESRRFAEDVGTSVRLIETNMIDLIRRPGPWWSYVYHSVALLGVCAPLTAVTNISKILIAASYTKEFDIPWGSHPEVDNRIRWADIQVVHDSYELSRQQKLRTYISPYTRDYNIALKVCWTGRKKNLEESRPLYEKGILNCSKCIKCVRTITGLLLEGIDPSKCSFEMSSFSISEVKRNLMDGRFIEDAEALYFWTDIQRHINDRPDSERDIYGANAFFHWMRTYDLSQVRRSRLDRLRKMFRTEPHQEIPLEGVSNSSHESSSSTTPWEEEIDNHPSS